jgi:hypothetical protein
MWDSNLGKHIFLDVFSTSMSHRFTSVCSVSATSAPPFQPLHQRNVCHVSWPRCEPLYARDTSHHKQEIFLYEYPLNWVLLLTKTNNAMLFFSGTHLKHGRHFDYWNQPLNVCMRVCYLDCHEVGVWCYVVTRKTYYVQFSALVFRRYIHMQWMLL